MVQHYAHKMIIRKDNPFYQLEQFLLTFLCLISSYMYAYIACFQGDSHEKWEVVVESLFAADLVLTFFVEVSPIVNTDQPVRNFTQIARRYIQGTLMFDIITLIPFHKVSLKYNLHFVLYLIKCFRYLKGRNIYNVPIIIKSLKEFIMLINFWVIEMKEMWQMSSFGHGHIHIQHTTNELKTQDKNKMFLLIQISLILKTIKLMIILLNIGYFTGMLWMIGCTYLYKYRIETDSLNLFAHEYFANLYKLDEKTINE